MKNNSIIDFLNVCHNISEQCNSQSRQTNKQIETDKLIRESRKGKHMGKKAMERKESNREETQKGKSTQREGGLILDVLLPLPVNRNFRVISG